MQAKTKLRYAGNREVKTTGFLSKKRGQILQVGYFMIIMLACALTILVMKLIITEFNSSVNEAGFNTTEITQAQNRIVVGWEMSDYAMLLLTIGLFIVLIMTSFMIPTHPVFLVINVFGIFFLVFIGMIVSSLYGNIVAGDDAVLGDQAETFEITNFLMSYLPFIVAGIIAVTSLVMYIRGQTGYG